MERVADQLVRTVRIRKAGAEHRENQVDQSLHQSVFGVAVNAGADAEVIGGKSDIDQRAGFAVQFVVGAVGRDDRKGVVAKGEFLVADFAHAGAGVVKKHLPTAMAVLGNRLVLGEVLPRNKKNIFHNSGAPFVFFSDFLYDYTMF